MSNVPPAKVDRDRKPNTGSDNRSGATGGQMQAQMSEDDSPNRQGTNSLQMKRPVGGKAGDDLFWSWAMPSDPGKRKS